MTEFINKHGIHISLTLTLTALITFLGIILAGGATVTTYANKIDSIAKTVEEMKPIVDQVKVLADEMESLNKNMDRLNTRIDQLFNTK